MLSGPRPLTSAGQAFSYFLHEYLARNDGSHRSANRWHGKGAEAAYGIRIERERAARQRERELERSRSPDRSRCMGAEIDMGR